MTNGQYTVTRTAFTAIFLAFCSSSSFGDLVVVPASADASIYESANGAAANGAGPRLFAGRSGVGLRRTLLEFNVAEAIPAGATIDAVELRLIVDRDAVAPPTSDFGLHRVLTAWNEGAAAAGIRGGTGAASGSGDVTWVHSEKGESEWGTPGGDFVANASAVVSISGTGPATWQTTSELVADVQGWLDFPDENFGWMLLGGETQSTSARRLHARESTATQSRPGLSIEFTLPQLLAGDFNGDRTVDLVDFSLLKDNFGGPDDVFEPGTSNGDGVIDLLDFNLLKDNFGASEAVPEPTSFLIAAFGTLAVSAASRRRLG